MLLQRPFPAAFPSTSRQKRTHRRINNTVHAQERQATTKAEDEQQDAQVPRGRNRYPQLGLRLSTWVDEQMEGAPAQWLEPFYTTLSGTSTASVAFSSTPTTRDVAEDDDEEAGDNSASSGLRAPRIGTRQKGLLEGQLQDLRQTPPLSSPTQNEPLAILFPPSDGPSSDLPLNSSSQQPQHAQQASLYRVGDSSSIGEIKDEQQHVTHPSHYLHHEQQQPVHNTHPQLQQQQPVHNTHPQLQPQQPQQLQHRHQQQQQQKNGENLNQQQEQQQQRNEEHLSQEEVREVLLAEGCPAPKRLIQGVQYMVEQQCFPGGREALSSWLQGVRELEAHTTLQIRTMLPGCYHIMLRTVDELHGTCAALQSLLGFSSPVHLAEYVARNPHLLYKPAQQLLADFESLLQMTRLPRPQLAAMAASNPGLLGCTHEGLRIKWQRLQANSASSDRWQDELQGTKLQVDTENGSTSGSGGAGAEAAMSHEELLAAALCAPHTSIDRLAWLQREGLQESTSMLQAVTCSPNDFNREHPDYKHFQSHHALLGAHYAASTHPLQRLVLEGGADLPRGSAGRWVNLHLQLRKQVEDAKRADEEEGLYLDIQHALAADIVMMDEWELSVHQ